jgi:diguanylate cyclase (GGDEF)-like protein
MSAFRATAQAMNVDRPDDITEDVYVGFVRSLFENASLLFVAAFSQAVIGTLVYWKTSAPIYIVLTILMVVVTLGRYYAIQRVKPDTIVTYQSALEWERYYLIAGTVHGSVVGFFAFTSLYIAPDLFGEVAAISMVLASAITIAGRNFGSRKMVVILTVSVIAPIALGLMLKGDFYNFILGLFIVPFIFTINTMARIVRTVLFTAISEEKKATRLAQRFNRALNTMSHGLIMLAPDGRVVVANAEAAHLMSLKSQDQLLGRTVHSLLMRGVAGGMLTAKDCQYVEAQLTRALREGRDRKVLVGFSNGQHYEFSAREGSQELGVITFEDVTARVEAEERIRFMARYDSLTGLINRAYFHELVEECMSSGNRDRFCALAAIDLDDFKSVNDTLGHPVGDGLIYAVAERLTSFSAPGVKVSRFGGDEFMIFFDRVESEGDLGRILDDIFAGLQGEVDVAGHVLRIQASAGAVMARVEHSDVDEMIVKADLALYKAKELGKNGWRMFESSMDAAFRNRQMMKADLRSAVEANTLRVVYQPIVSMTTMRIAGCEALCRWDHPELGPISPSVFIPLAEEMGIISDISTFVLNAACAECAKWPENTNVSVNLSARDFRNRNVIQKVRDALASSGLAPERLEVEVTETALLDDKSATRELIQELKGLGVRIALDDFGTGYSSLSYLHKLPLDKVKIDRSFLVDLTSQSNSLVLLKGIVDLTRTLGLTITIEGVENFEQLKVLMQSIRPDLVQGFLFGSALTAAGIETMSTTVWPFARELRSASQRAIN